MSKAKNIKSARFPLALTVASMLIYLLFLLGAHELVQEISFRKLPAPVTALEMAAAFAAEAFLVMLFGFLLLAVLRFITRLFACSKRTVLGAAFAMLFPFYLLQICSWYLLFNYGSLLSLRQLLSLVNYINRSSLLHVISSQQLAQIAIVPSMAAVLSLIAALVARRTLESPARSNRSFFLLASCALSAVVACRHYSFGEKVHRILANALSPEFALFSDFPRQTISPFADGSLGLRMSLQEWQQVVVAPKGGKNVLLIVVEALRGDVFNEAGGSRVMASTAAFCKGGFSTNRMHAAASDTGYSMEAILTGLYPYRGGLRHRNDKVTESNMPTLYDFFKSAGYATAHITSTEWRATAELVRRPSLDFYFDAASIGDRVPGTDEMVLGFDTNIIDQARDMERSSSDLDLMGIDRLKNFIAGVPADRSFFASIYLLSSHLPWVTPPGYPKLNKIDRDSMKDLDPGSLRMDRSDQSELRLVYENALNYTDSLVGKILEVLTEQGVLDSTVVVLTGDHGEALGEHGLAGHATSLYEEQIVVPFLVCNSELPPPSGASEHSSSHVDVAPTLLRLAGLAEYNAFQGLPLIPPPGGTSLSEKRRIVFSILQAFDEGIAAVSLPNKIIYYPRSGRSLLFDLANDPAESRNIAEGEANVAALLGQTLREFIDMQQAYYLLPFESQCRLAPPLSLGVAAPAFGKIEMSAAMKPH